MFTATLATPRPPAVRVSALCADLMCVSARRRSRRRSSGRDIVPHREGVLCGLVFLVEMSATGQENGGALGRRNGDEGFCAEPRGCPERVRKASCEPTRDPGRRQAGALAIPPAWCPASPHAACSAAARVARRVELPRLEDHHPDAFIRSASRRDAPAVRTSAAWLQRRRHPLERCRARPS